jgi:hypothetical protein
VAIAVAKMDDRHLSEAKEKYLLEGQKAYIAMNGAGAAALLAFLQAIWSNHEAAALRIWVLCGIISFAVGAAAGAVSYPVRHRAFVIGSSKANHLLYQIAYWYIPAVSISAFLLGLGLPVIGGFKSL